MISVKEALNIILNEVRPIGLEKTAITNALGRTLGEDIYSNRFIPPTDNSAMDGYAVKSQDTVGSSKDTPTSLKVIEDLPAGYISKNTIRTGEAIRIMTGACIPEGADAVVMLENTSCKKAGHKDEVSEIVEILKEAVDGENIRPAGEDVKPGELVIEKGSVISPAEISMMAAMGKAFIHVYQRPKVSILSTGDELVDVGEPLLEGRIVNSNSYALYAQVLSAGCVPVLIGIARDNIDSLKEKLLIALNGDVVVTSAGVSVGDYDYVKAALRDLGAEMKFWKVAIKPGKPLAFGIVKEKPLFGLPGNPVSTMIGFEEFIRPALLKFMGRKMVYRRVVEAILKNDIRKKPGRRHFIQATIEEENERMVVVPLKARGSGVLSSMVKSQGLITLAEDITEAKAGSKVKVQILREDYLNQGNIGF